MADKALMETEGGQNAVAVAAGTAADAVLSGTTGGGRLCKVHCVTAGTVSLQIFDSITTSGDPAAVLLYQTTAALNPGDTVSVQVPYSNGIIPKCITNTPGVVVTFSKDTVYGR